MTLEPDTEYAISDVYLPTMKGNPRKRDTLRFRTDSEGRVWIKGVGKPEDPWFARWCATHPRLTRVSESREA